MYDKKTERDNMLNKNTWYSIHLNLIFLCVASFKLSWIFGLTTCAVAYYVDMQFEIHCLGFYYKKRENFEVDVINVEWEFIPEKAEGQIDEP
jgi:hypothetical protein